MPGRVRRGHRRRETLPAPRLKSRYNGHASGLRLAGGQLEDDVLARDGSSRTSTWKRAPTRSRPAPDLRGGRAGGEPATQHPRTTTSSISAAPDEVTPAPRRARPPRRGGASSTSSASITSSRSHPFADRLHRILTVRGGVADVFLARRGDGGKRARSAATMSRSRPNRKDNPINGGETMQNQASLQETKQHGAVRLPFNLYPCTIQIFSRWHCTGTRAWSWSLSSRAWAGTGGR